MNMKRILILIIGLFGVAQAQFAPTSAKTAFKWGVSIGTRDSTAYAANDSLVVVINRQGRMMYRSTDGYWKLLSNVGANDYVPYNGANANVFLGSNRIKADAFDLGIPSSSTDSIGRMRWNADDLTMNIGLTSSVVLQSGQEMLILVKNQTGVTIPNGTVVRQSGVVGASGRLKVEPFLANGTHNSNQVLGLTTEDIPNGGDGFVAYFGKVRGLNTAAYPDSTILYASPTVAGGLTNVVPEAPNNIVKIGTVVKSASNGIIFARVVAGSNINQDEGVQLTNPLNNSLLVYDSLTTLWKDKTLVEIGAVRVQDTAAMLAPYLRSNTAAGTYVTIATDQNITGKKSFTQGQIWFGSNQTGQSIVGGSNGISFGNSNSLSGTSNIVLGFESYGNGNQGISIGFNANSGSTGATNNIAIGQKATEYISSGSDNIAIGTTAANGLSTGSGNIALGRSAGNYIVGSIFQLQTNTNSVFIGNGTRGSANGNTNEVVIGEAALGNGSNTVTIGNSSITNNYFTGNIRGGAFIRSGGTSSQFLKADGSVDGNTYLTSSDITGKLNISDTATMLSNYRRKTTLIENSDLRNSAITINGTSTALGGSISVGTVTSVTASAPLSSSGGTTPNITISQATTSTNGFLSSTDWNTFNNKQAQLNGTGFVRFSGTTPSYITGTSSQFVKADGSLDGTSYATAASISGTTNYIPKFTSSSVIGNSALQEVSGNLGLGVTPSAWNTIKPLEIGNAGNFFAGFQGGSAIYIGAGAYFSSGWKYATTGNRAAYYDIGEGSFKWNTAPSGTAGNPITFTQAMTLTANSELLINTTTTDGTNKLIVNGGVKVDGGGNDGLKINNAGSVLSLFAENTVSNSIIRLKSTTNSVWDLQANTNGSFQIDVADAAALTIASTGAATFSSTISARGAFSTYVADGLFGASALPSKILTPSSNEILFGYWDNGAGGYFPRIGFKGATNWGMGIASDNNSLIISTGNSGTAAAGLTLSSTGAATFSSTISARGAFSTYVADGLFGASALPSKILTPSSNEILFGYWDNGAGGYFPRIGFKGATNWGMGIASDNNSLIISTGNSGTAAAGLTLSSTGAATFSGVINGTSQTDAFSFTNSSGGGAYVIGKIGNAAGTLKIGVNSNSGGDLVSGSPAYAVGLIYNSNRDFIIGTNNAIGLTLNATTNAATFSSSVTATEGLFGGAVTNGTDKLRVSGNTSTSQLITGSFNPNMILRNTATTLSSLYTTVIANGGSNYTYTLDAASGHNRIYIIRAYGSGTSITLNRSGSDVIVDNAGNNQTSLTITPSGGAVWVQSNGLDAYIQLK